MWTNVCSNYYISTFTFIIYSAGIIMAFFSNQQVFDSAQQLENTVDRSFSRAGNFVNDSLTVCYVMLFYY